MLLHGKEKHLISIDDLVDGSVPEDMVDLDLIYRLAIDNSNDEHQSRAGHLHPSSVGNCKLSNVLQYRNTPPTDRRSKEFIEIVTLGHSIHDIVQGRFARLAPLLKPYGITFRFASEVRYNPDTDELFEHLDLGGTTDGIIEIEARTWKQRIVLEIKSQNKEFHEKTKKLGASPQHLMQAHLYAYRYDTPFIVLWYYCKDNSKRLVFRHTFDPQTFEDAIRYFEELHAYGKTGALPEREESYMGCKECVYRTLCKPAILERSKSHAVPKAGLRRKK